MCFAILFFFFCSLHFLHVCLYILDNVCIVSKDFSIVTALLAAPVFRVCCFCDRLHVIITIPVQIKGASRRVSDSLDSSHSASETQVLCLDSAQVNKKEFGSTSTWIIRC